MAKLADNFAKFNKLDACCTLFSSAPGQPCPIFQRVCKSLAFFSPYYDGPFVPVKIETKQFFLQCPSTITFPQLFE